MKTTISKRAVVTFTTLIRVFILTFFWVIPGQVSAAIITFDFLSLIEDQTHPVTGSLGDGTPYSGPALATSYEDFRWKQNGLGVTASARYLPEDNEGNVIADLPSFVFLQPSYAGLGVCRQANCTHGSQMSYEDKLLLQFSEVVDIIGLEFSIGQDDSNIPPEEDDYRAYNTRLNATGAVTGPMSDIMGSGRSWQGLLTGNLLSFYRPEGTGAFLESITVRTSNGNHPPSVVFEPTSWGLLLLALILGELCRRWTRRRLHGKHL